MAYWTIMPLHLLVCGEFAGEAMQNNGLAGCLSPPARMGTISTKTPCARNPPDIGEPATWVSPGFLVVKISIMGFL
jgi:hypothetical protein